MQKSNKIGIRASFVSLFINLGLAIVKLLSGIIGKSNAMLADGIHTLSDVFTTVVVIVGLKISSKEADDNHPYGHERFELVFSKLLSLFLGLTGLFIGVKGIKSLVSKEIQIPGKSALIAALASIVVKEIMYRYTINIARKIESVSMEADAWHHRSDAFSSVGVFIGVLGARLGYPMLDPLASIIVSVMVIKVGVNLYLESIKGLVDQSASEETIQMIENLTLGVKGVKKIKTLKTRIFGNKLYVDLDILVDGCLKVHEGHDIAEEVHNIIENKIKGVKHCMVHVEPSTDSCK